MVTFGSSGRRIFLLVVGVRSDSLSSISELDTSSANRTRIFVRTELLFVICVLLVDAGLDDDDDCCATIF
jgi:hypothetical protein